MNKVKSSYITHCLYTPKDLETKTTPYTPKGIWQSGQVIVSNCEVEKGQTKIVVMIPAAYMKIRRLMDKFPSDEWLAFLVGSETEAGYIIKDIRIPKQVIQAATVDVDAEDATDLSDVIGTIHSHHTMGAFFSSTDNEHIAPNHPVSIVVSKDDWMCKTKIALPCGHNLIKDATLEMDTTVRIDFSGLDAQIAANIRKPAPVVFPITSNYSTWKGYFCVSCHNNFKSFTDVTWRKRGYICKTCQSKLGILTDGQWNVLVDELQKEIARKPAATDTKYCAWCKTLTTVDNMQLINDHLVCKDCIKDAEDIATFSGV